MEGNSKSALLLKIAAIKVPMQSSSIDKLIQKLFDMIIIGFESLVIKLN